MTSLPRAGHRWFGVLTLALSFVLAASGPALAASPNPTTGPDGGPVEVDVPINPTAFVQIEVEGIDRNGNPFTKAGYGLIIDETGVILAPANLVAPDAPGVAVGYHDWSIPATV
ncbi:MAG: hypothetical protein FJ038_10715 [Chloroflexi bacterium]|nr:hypothetical protein [Chloroflexota bacterium]